MPQNTNLNVSPYFDDFVDSKNYHKVLFKPGFPIQARELTTLQTILQDQVEKFGQHFFKEGSMVIPGGVTYDSDYTAVKIDPNFLNVPVSSYTKVLADNKIEIKGETTGVEATVVNRLTSSESVDGFDTLYIKYTKSGTDGESSVFADGENLITLSSINYANTSIAENGQFARCIVSDSTSTGSALSVTEGVFFIRGFFVKNVSSTIILDQYSNKPSCRAGFLLKEEVISPSLVNSDLYDNAKGFSNESAPGADRFRLLTTLHKKSLTDNDDTNFVELLRVENGVAEEIATKTEYNQFAEELARRTYDESGDYYVSPFSLEVRESLNDRIGNKGIYFDTQTTSNGNAPGEDSICLQVSSGKAYVRGYEVEKIATTSLDILKPRTTKTLENQSVPIRVGTSIKINNVKGTPTTGFSNDAKIKLVDQRLAVNKFSTNGTIIGDARVFDFSQKAASGIGVTTYDLKVYDIQLYTVLTVSNDATIAADSYVKGKYSGSAGYAVAAVSGGTSVTLRDVNGTFQVNEPLIINGIDSGNNITEIVDNDIESIKAVHSTTGLIGGVGSGNTTFAGNTVLDRKKQVFNDGTEIRISGSGSTRTLDSAQIADFRSQLKVGDIITYGTSGNNIPTFNRVTAVTQNNATIAAVANVSGICSGAVTNGTRSGVSALIPTLNESNNPGLRVRLANDYVASVNVLDSSYITRKQFTATVSGSSAVFNISALGGDTSELFFELFSVENYVLDVNDNPITLFEPQVTVSANLKTVTISGLPNGSATLTAAVRRSKLVSKQKTITRCENLIVSKSELSGSGIGSTSLNDGLSFSQVYGTRVQDEEISLNFSEATRVLAVLESNDTNDPELPVISVDEQSDTFTSNVLVGEQFIGATSGAVARVVVVGATQLSFVYENENTFQSGESISLMTSGITARISDIVIGDTNIVDNFTLDNGHRDDFVDYARLVRNSDAEKPTRKIRVIFDRLVNDESMGNIETVNSYNTLDYSEDVPFVFDSWASDYIDFRPRVAPYTSSNNSPFSYASRDFSGSGSETVVTNKTVVIDYSYYLGRVDRLYLGIDGVFTLKEGKPSRVPKAPVPDEKSFQVATLSYPPYVRNASEIVTKTVPHKRYTMRDIGSLENRIKNLENYTTLSLLESDTKNLSVKDPNTGLDKFKSGFYVDNFQNHKTHNLKGESNFDIDIVRGEGRPRSTERNISLVFETDSSSRNPITTDYNFVNDFNDSNITRGGPALTLSYTEETFMDQPNATRVENLNPFLVDVFIGKIELSPSSDFWIEETVLPSQNIQVDSVFDGIADLLGVDNENGGMASSFWNSSETTWNGRDSATLIDEDIINRRVLDTRTSITQTPRTFTTTTTRDIRNTIRQTFEETGVEREFGLELSAAEEVIDLGTKVVGMNVLYNVRSRNVQVFAERVKPNTRYYVFMENTDLTQYAIPKFLPIEMVKGTFGVNDIVESVSQSNERNSVPEIKFRVATPNHKEGPYNNPSEVITNLAYPETTLSSAYSSTSEVLNIDTADLSLENNVEHSGYVFRGMTLVNEDGSAEATVKNIRLVSDDKGDLIFSLHIPDPQIASNPVFTTGNNTIRITTDSGNAAILDPGSSSAEAEYFASGYQTNTQDQTLSIKKPVVERIEVGREDVTRTFNRRRTETVTESDSVTAIRRNRNTSPARRRRVRRRRGGRTDPLAQSFLISPENYNDGIFITSGEVFFKTKDKRVPVSVQIRTMRDGIPTQTIVPFGETKIKPRDVNISDDGSVPTTFTFKSPVYLQAGVEYCMVLMAPHTLNYLAFINRMGEVDLITQGLNATQPVLGSLFKSQNNSTWTPSQYEDLKFKLNKAKFVTNQPSSVLLYNSRIKRHKIKRRNPVTTFSKRLNVELGATTQTVITQGDKFEQTVNSFVHTGKVFAVGGPIKTGASGSNLTVVGNTGIGLTPTSGSQVYSGIGITSLTGFGQGATADVTVQNGAVTAANINIQNGGKGYAPGDLLMLNALGSTGSGVRVVVKSHVGLGGTNIIILDDVKNNFVNSQDMIHFPNGGGQNTIANADITSVIADPIRDGYTMRVKHKNHGMHSNTNEFRITRFKPDVKPTTLTQKIDDDTTIISLASATGFNIFEDQTVSADFPGFVQIDKEVIKYTGVNGNTLTGITRAIDAGVDDRRKSDHKAKAYVYKYEFNGISLRKINKRHDMDPREKTFNSYHVKVSTASTEVSFRTTKSGGGNDVHITQNIPFEAINPQITSITPTGTNISARIKTTSGTSLSGNEPSFNDMGYENVALNKINYFDTPRMVASGTNEYHLLDNNKSLSLELTLSTNNSDVSPVVDLENANAILFSNLVDDKVDDFETDSRTKVPGSDPNNAIYETKLIKLEFVSNSLMVQFDGHREAEGDIRVFYKLVRSDGGGARQSYVPFNTNGLPDTTVKPNAKRNTFSEYKFTAENTAQFNAFMIKVVMTSTNQAKPPRIKNFRAIALRSFEIE